MGERGCHSPAHCSHRVHWRPHIPLLCYTCQDLSWLGSYWHLTGTAFWPCCQRAWKGGVEPEKRNQGKGSKRMHRKLIVVIVVACQGATLTGHRRANSKPVEERLRRSWNYEDWNHVSWTDTAKGITMSRNSAITVVPFLEPASSPESKQEQTGTSASKHTGAFEILKREINYHLVLLSFKQKEHKLCKPRDKRWAGRETKGEVNLQCINSTQGLNWQCRSSEECQGDRPRAKSTLREDGARSPKQQSPVSRCVMNPTGVRLLDGVEIVSNSGRKLSRRQKPWFPERRKHQVSHTHKKK